MNALHSTQLSNGLHRRMNPADTSSDRPLNEPRSFWIWELVIPWHLDHLSRSERPLRGIKRVAGLDSQFGFWSFPPRSPRLRVNPQNFIVLAPSLRFTKTPEQRILT
jgi:hypothetical protein